MFFAPVGETEMQAARLLTGATMIGFFAAPLFRQRARQIRIGIFVAYLLGVIVFVARHL